MSGLIPRARAPTNGVDRRSAPTFRRVTSASGGGGRCSSWGSTRAAPATGSPLLPRRRSRPRSLGATPTPVGRSWRVPRGFHQIGDELPLFVGHIAASGPPRSGHCRVVSHSRRSICNYHDRGGPFRPLTGLTSSTASRVLERRLGYAVLVDSYTPALATAGAPATRCGRGHEAPRHGGPSSTSFVALSSGSRGAVVRFLEGFSRVSRFCNVSGVGLDAVEPQAPDRAGSCSPRHQHRRTHRHHHLGRHQGAAVGRARRSGPGVGSRRCAPTGLVPGIHVMPSALEGGAS